MFEMAQNSPVEQRLGEAEGGQQQTWRKKPRPMGRRGGERVGTASPPARDPIDRRGQLAGGRRTRRHFGRRVVRGLVFHGHRRPACRKSIALRLRDPAGATSIP